MIFCKCGGEMGVTDTRVRHDGTQRRTRKCETCGEKTTTLEIEEQRYKQLSRLEKSAVKADQETMIQKATASVIEAQKEWHRQRCSPETGGTVFGLPETFARAVIAAMREPTKEMITGEGMHWDYSCHVCGGWKEGWYAMIDAALGKVTNEQP